MTDLFDDPEEAFVSRGKVRRRRGGWSWGPVESARMRFLSLGAGIQSSTLVCMMIERTLPWVDHIIMADTGDERAATMEHVEWLRGAVARATNGQTGFHVVARSTRLSEELQARYEGSRGYVTPPLYLEGRGQIQRQCTRYFKVIPLQRKQRELLGYKKGERIPPGISEVWIGISTDEVVRAGAAYENWAANRFPLLELRMSRRDCERWLAEHGYPVPPKSACIFCPYRSNLEWRRLKELDPAAFAEACAIDKRLREAPNVQRLAYLHDSRRPLAEVDFSTAEENGQGMLNLCEGGCGL